MTTKIASLNGGNQDNSSKKSSEHLMLQVVKRLAHYSVRIFARCPDRDFAADVALRSVGDVLLVGQVGTGDVVGRLAAL